MTYKKIRYYDIHGLVRVKESSSLSNKANNVRAHLKPFEVEEVEEAMIDIDINDYSAFSAAKKNSATLDLPHKRLACDLASKKQSIWCDKIDLHPKYLVQNALLKKSHTLVHAAAVTSDGSGVLFPAFGGVGKTTTLSTLVHERGFQLLGDDLIILGENKMKSYPIDFSVYPHHVDVLGISDKKIRRRLSINKRLGQLENRFSSSDSRIFKLLKLTAASMGGYVKVSPEKIFGPDHIANESSLNKIFFLERYSGEKITCHSSGPTMLARRAANALFNEWKDCLGLLYTYSGTVENFSINDQFSIVRKMYEEIFLDTEAFTVSIPYNMNNDTLSVEMLKIVDTACQEK
jgi:hypothetical protein